MSRSTETTTHPCLLIWGVWPFRYTGSSNANSKSAAVFTCSRFTHAMDARGRSAPRCEQPLQTRLAPIRQSERFLHGCFHCGAAAQQLNTSTARSLHASETGSAHRSRRSAAPRWVRHASRPSARHVNTSRQADVASLHGQVSSGFHIGDARHHF